MRAIKLASDLRDGTVDEAIAVLERLDRMADALAASGLAVDVVVSVDVAVRLAEVDG